jgi:Fur family peroxide stress response transcriptional regulator
MENIVILLKERGLKVTPQRIAIAEAIEEYGHIDIDKLYEVIKKRFPTISLATLYKNINSFLEKEFIREVAIPSHKTKYELIMEEHAHFICRKCGKVEDIDVDKKRLENAIPKGIENVERVSLSIYGVCC